MTIFKDSFEIHLFSSFSYSNLNIDGSWIVVPTLILDLKLLHPSKDMIALALEALKVKLMLVLLKSKNYVGVHENVYVPFSRF